MKDNPIHSRPLSAQGRKNYDEIFRKPTTGAFRGVLNPPRETGEHGAILKQDGTIHPAGPINPHYKASPES